MYRLDEGPQDPDLGHDCARYVDGATECLICGWCEWEGREQE